MQLRRTLLTGVLLMASVVTQQPGIEAPKLLFRTSWNDAPESLVAARGKVVLLYFATTRLGRQSLPRRLDDLHAKYGDKGLVVMALFDRAPGLVEALVIGEIGVKYPVAAISRSAADPFRIQFYGSACCIAADGTVYSTPADGVPDDKVVEWLLRDIVHTPAIPDGKQFRELRRLWSTARYAKLANYLDRRLRTARLADDQRAVLTEHQRGLNEIARGRIERATELAAGPDYLAARHRLQRMAKDWRDFPAGDAAKQELVRFDKDKTIQREIAGMEDLHAIIVTHDLRIEVQRQRFEKALLDLRNDYRGSHAASRAKDIAKRVGVDSKNRR